jgi:catechol 2,3-dioxygenase-like lactoylglutathione lyase family enzyme
MATNFHPITVSDGSGMAPSASTHIRIARPSRDLAAAERFYVQGLGLKVLFRHTFEEGGHEHSILMLGYPKAAWHLELVHAPGDADFPVAAPTEEDLLVLYLDGKVDAAVVDQLREKGGKKVKARNAYWEECGVTVADPDGYRVVLTVRAWENEELVE